MQGDLWYLEPNHPYTTTETPCKYPQRRLCPKAFKKTITNFWEKMGVREEN